MKNYILSLMHFVNEIYHHPTLGFKINFVIREVHLIDDQYTSRINIVPGQPRHRDSTTNVKGLIKIDISYNYFRQVFYLSIKTRGLQAIPESPGSREFPGLPGLG